MSDLAIRPLAPRARPSATLCLALWAALGAAAACGDATGPEVTVAAGPPRISAGGAHTCALSAGGTAWCWGAGGSGQLGDGTTTSRASPVAVGGSLTFRAISAGYDHTCALTVSGVAFCWGDNFWDQLGDGTGVRSRPNPAPVAGGLSLTAISAGSGHTCALAAGGAAYCWGSRWNGQLGDSTLEYSSPRPVAVVGGHTFRIIAAGGGHTCGLTARGTAYCWGATGSGQLGDGTYGDSYGGRPYPAELGSSLTFSAISAGANHTCGATAREVTYCTGENTCGQLGVDTRPDYSRPSPAAVSGGPALGTISAGGSHTCGLTAEGAAYCWGQNYQGQVGDGTTGDARWTPVAVVGGHTFGPSPAPMPAATGPHP